jgi:hypothetical protein
MELWPAERIDTTTGSSSVQLHQVMDQLVMSQSKVHIVAGNQRNTLGLAHDRLVHHLVQLNT